MPNPTSQWSAVLVDAAGKVQAETTRYFTAQNLARDGSKEMLRMAPDTNHSVAVFKQIARMDMTTDFKVVIL